MYRLKDLREDNDLSQKNVADILNIPTRTYSSYENEERSLPIDILIKLARFYNTSSDFIIGLTNISKPYPNRKIKIK